MDVSFATGTVREYGSGADLTDFPRIRAFRVSRLERQDARRGRRAGAGHVIQIVAKHSREIFQSDEW